MEGAPKEPEDYLNMEERRILFQIYYDLAHQRRQMAVFHPLDFLHLRGLYISPPFLWNSEGDYRISSISFGSARTFDFAGFLTRDFCWLRRPLMWEFSVWFSFSRLGGYTVKVVGRFRGFTCLSGTWRSFDYMSCKSGIERV